MILRIFYRSLAIAILLLAQGAARAADDSRLYAVSGVAVDVTARSATEARNLAIAQGQREAFTRLIRKLVAYEDQALVPALGNDEIANLVLGIDIANERSSTTRYLADLSVVFDDGAVRRLLGELGVSFAETRTLPVLLLPVFSAAGANMLWGPENSWYAAWRNYPTGASLMNFVLPANDHRDRLLIAARHVLAIRPDRLRAIAAHYQSEDVIITHATLTTPLNSSPARLDVELKRGLTLQPLRSFMVEQREDEDQAALFARAIAMIDADLSEAWKAQVLVQYGNQAELIARVAIDDIAGWQNLQSRLAQVSQVRRFILTALSVTEARLAIEYFGGLETLKRSLAEQSLELTTEEDGSWLLANAVTK